MRLARGRLMVLALPLVLAACVTTGPSRPRDRVVVRPEAGAEAALDRRWRAWRLADRSDFLRCRLEDGRIRMDGKWRRYEPEVFVVMRSQTRRIRVVREDGRRGRFLWVRYRGHGRVVKLCSVPPEDAPRSRCIALKADHRRAFRHGLTGVLSAKRAFRQVTFTCRWPQRKPPFELVFGPDT